MTRSTTDRHAQVVRAAFAMVIISALAGCASAASPSPAASQAPAVASPSPRGTGSIAPSPTASPSPSPSPSPLASAGPIGAGPWRSIAWTTADRHALPRLTAVTGEAVGVEIYGWSGGYLAFASDGGATSGTDRAVVLMESSSTDGLQWTAPRALDVAGFADQVSVVAVVEGPAGLLAVGHDPADTCGGPPSVAALWQSHDGQAWSRIAGPKGLASRQVLTVDAGSAGYIATGLLADGVTPTVWTSHDARDWTRKSLTGKPFGTIVLDGGASFAGGFILAGSVLGPEGCGGAAHQHPSLWHSADGATWTKARLPGASTAANVSMTVRRLGDGVLVAIAAEVHASGDDTEQVWTSEDGTTWTPRTTTLPLTWQPLVEAGKEAFVVLRPEDGDGPLEIAPLGPDLRVRPLAATGDVPTLGEDLPGWQVAVGPAGILALADDQSELRIGHPGR